MVVLHPGIDGSFSVDVMCSYFQSRPERIVHVDLVGVHAFVAEHWRNHDHEEVSQLDGGRIFHGRGRSHVTDVLLPDAHIHWLPQGPAKRRPAGGDGNGHGLFLPVAVRPAGNLCRDPGRPPLGNIREPGRARTRAGLVRCHALHAVMRSFHQSAAKHRMGRLPVNVGSASFFYYT